MTPRRRLALAVGGALTLNGLILGALSRDHGSRRPAMATNALQDSTIWLSLDPGTLPDRGNRMARAAGDAIPIGDKRSATVAPRTDPELAPAPWRSFDAAPVAASVPPIPPAGLPDMGDKIARSLRARLGCSSARDTLSTAESDLCDGRMVRDAAPISGSGDARRDRRLARQGARQIEAYVARRQRPGGAVRPTCEDAGPVSDCGVDVSIEIFSSLDGFFPGLRPDDDD